MSKHVAPLKIQTFIISVVLRPISILLVCMSHKFMFSSKSKFGTTSIYEITQWPIIVAGGPGSSVGIATGYGLDGPGIESRWWGARFSAPVQTGPGAHPASCTMGTGSFPGVKSGRDVTLTPHPLLVPLVMKE